MDDVTPARPGEDTYAAATAVFNTRAVPRPGTALVVRTVGEVRHAVTRAARTGTPVRVLTTGHAAGGVRPVRGGLLLRTELDEPVTVDPARRVARFPAGARWSQVVDAAAVHGLTATHGSSGGVGVVGYLLNGGLSPYGRECGLAVNSLLAVDLVTADGHLRHVDANEDPDLFWALRGGGGGFGVVVAAEVALFPAAAVLTGAAYWPAEHAERLLSTWLSWSATAPRAVTTSARLLNLPDVAGVPAELAGRVTFAVDGAVLAATPARLGAARRVTGDLLGPLRAIAAPVLDTWKQDTVQGVLAAHMDPDQPIPVLGDHQLLGPLDERGAAAVLSAVEPGSPLVVAGLRQLGGAYAAPGASGGALDRLDAAFSWAASGPVLGPGADEDIRRACARARAALAPYDTGRTVPGFVEDFDQPQGHLGAEEMRRVAQVRARVDPGGLFRDDVIPAGVDSSSDRSSVHQ